MAMTTKQALQKALKIVKNHWVKGEFDNGWGRHCALGAVKRVADSPAIASSAAAVLSISLPPPYTGGSVIDFNDNVAKHKDIIKLFKRAIKSC